MAKNIISWFQAIICLCFELAGFGNLFAVTAATFVIHFGENRAMAAIDLAVNFAGATAHSQFQTGNITGVKFTVSDAVPCSYSIHAHGKILYEVGVSSPYFTAQKPANYEDLLFLLANEPTGYSQNIVCTVCARVNNSGCYSVGPAIFRNAINDADYLLESYNEIVAPSMRLFIAWKQVAPHLVKTLSPINPVMTWIQILYYFFKYSFSYKGYIVLAAPGKKRSLQRITLLASVKAFAFAFIAWRLEAVNTAHHHPHTLKNAGLSLLATCIACFIIFRTPSSESLLIWIAQRTSVECRRIAKLEEFKGHDRQMFDHETDWRSWVLATNKMKIWDRTDTNVNTITDHFLIGVELYNKFESLDPDTDKSMYKEPCEHLSAMRNLIDMCVN